MIDTVIIHIPIQQMFTKAFENTYQIIGDVADYGLIASTRYITRDPTTKEITHGELYHPFESLPSNHSGVAVKFFDKTINTLPYVSLNASIAKIQQGHNVYGHDVLYNGVVDMLNVLKDTYPTFWQVLDIDKARLSRIDITYSAKMQNRSQAEKVRDFLRNVDWGRLRNDSKQERWNSIYFGASGSRIGVGVVYCKGIELENEIKDLTKKAKQGCSQSKAKLTILNNRLQQIADPLIRFEARCKSRQLEQMGLPNNLWDFIAHSIKNKTTLKQMWQYKFHSIFEALKGKHMTHADDSQIWELLKQKLTTTTPTGKISETKARNAYNFYKRLKQDGFLEVKKKYSKSQFCLLTKSLINCGISRSHLQNLHNKDGEIVPIIEILNIDFKDQLPNDYILPISNHLVDFESHLNQRNIHLRPQIKVANVA